MRGYSIFNKVEGGSSKQAETAYQSNAPLSQQRTSEEIARSIEQYKQSIRLKTQSGVSLSRAIGAQVEPDRHRKLQRYEIFIDKMQRLFLSEMRYQRKQEAKLRLQENAIVYSNTPLKDIMIAYNELSNTPRGGFNSEAVVATLQNLAKAIRARGYKGRPQGDYSITELDHSWRMSRLVEDIQFGLREDQFFSPHLLAQVSLNLGELSYKNTDLIPHIFKKLQAQLAERFDAASFEQTSLAFNDAVYGGTMGQVSRHYIFKGFQDSKEFQEYMGILMEWEGEAGAESALQGEIKSAQVLSAEAEELQKAMNDIINAAVQVKEFQQEYQASIDNLRNQYFQMSEATDKHAFLQENEYIKYDLLELQELLVKGGYVEPDEALSVLTNEPFDQRMQRASDIFYDYVVNFAPELISPQYNSFFEAASKSLPKRGELHPSIIKENQNVISLSTLSQTLVGVSQQALSFRRDVQYKDYLNKFYEEYLMPNDQKLYNHEPHGENKHIQTDTIMMERGYLLAWQQFKEGTAQVLPRFRELVRADKDCLEGQLHALSALNACRFEEKELRREIVDNALRLIAQPGVVIEQSAIANGLLGLAESPASSHEKVRQLAQKLAEKLDFSKLTSFSQQVNALWSLCALQQYDARSLAQGLRQINQLNFERVDSEVRYEEFQKIADIYNALKIESPSHNANERSLQLTNEGLLLALQNQQVMNNIKYIESHTKFDPFKQRVVQGLTKGLTSASIEHQLIQENELYETQVLDADILNASKYPYKPDIIMGYKGQKVGVFVLPETSVTRDTYQADGAQQFRQRLLHHVNPSIKLAALPITQVVDYDIAGLSVGLKKDFEFNALLENQIGSIQSAFDFNTLTAFGASFVQQAAGYIETLSLTHTKEAAKLDALIQRLYQTLQIKQQIELRFEASQKAAGYDELRFSLMKLSLLYDSLNKESKNFVDSYASPSATDFKTILQATISQIPRNTAPAQQVQGIDGGWLGTRLEVELPVSGKESFGSSGFKKNIVPEMINQRLMWVEDYFHYDDWRSKQKEVFDNFNLLVVPTAPTSEHNKFFFDQDSHSRRIPQGIFPYPTHKRQLMLPAANHTLVEVLSQPLHDDYVKYEKEPMKMMVINELGKSQTLKPIDDDTSMITNLLNIKQGLKSDFSDSEIINTILSNLSFTEQLIEEHLGKSKTAKGAAEVKYLPRDAKSYRNFIASTYHSKDREDPFTHFYLKEGKTREHINKLIEDEKDLQARIEEGSSDFAVIEDGDARRQALQEKIENMLLAEERINEDILQHTTQLKTTVNVKYDMKTLVKSEFIYDVEPELLDESITDEQYLEQSRRRAEAKLIKMKLIHKLYNSTQELTPNESAYLKQWVADIKGGKDRNLLNLRDSMLPKRGSSKLTLNALDAQSLYALNSISRVNINRERHGAYALSDLVLELSHFLDEDVVNKVETEIYSERMRQEWGLSKDFKAVESRNKEIGLVLNELEELAWRSAGQLNEKDIAGIKSMISVKRGKDYFDQQFFQNDMESFSQFVADANSYDSRIELVERWIVRKEDEIKVRVQLPPEALKKTDQELNRLIDAPQKQAREKLAAKLLIADEFGNPIDTGKKYTELTSRELHSLAENLSLRLYLFNYDYPAFLPQVMRAVIEHPALLKSDRDQLELYARMFEVDWRGDRALENKNQFMATNPIYLEGSNLKSYGQVTDEVVKERLHRACAPYVEEAARRVLNA